MLEIRRVHRCICYAAFEQAPSRTLFTLALWEHVTNVSSIHQLRQLLTVGTTVISDRFNMMTQNFTKIWQ